MGRIASPNKNDFSTQLEEQEKNIALLKKEIQIEAALEKVRARTMAMQKTEELPQIINILFQQLQELSFDVYACNLILVNEKLSQEMWIAGYSKDILPKSYEIYYTDHLYFTHFIEAWQNGISYDVFKYEGQKKKDYDQYVFFKTGMANLPEESKAEIMNIEETNICAAYMKYGWIETNASDLISDDQAQILQRFAKVFEQTYTRFLDLKKAEAQAREAEIQLALERVRARTMAMQKSEELGDVVKVLYQEFKILGMADWGCAIMIFDKEANQIEYWVSEATNSDLSCFYVKGQENSVYQKLWKHWEKQGESLNLHHKDKFKKEFDTYWLNETDFKRLPEAVKESVYADREIFLTFSTMQYGMLNATGKTKLSEGQIKVLERFAKVFEQTYTRFLDLQKAEEQAREARIETALEKIRSNMMAMHQSDQLRQVVATMFEQLQNLGFISSASMINIYNDDLSAEQWLAGFSHGELPKSYHIPYCDHPYFTEEVSGWQDGLPFHELIFEGPQKVEYGKWMIEHSDYKFLPAEFHQEMLSSERIYISNAHMKYGLVEVWGAEPLPEKSINILIRFAKVFEQTYTRFLDLQKAEAQAREAQLETALERVRSRTMAMQKSDEFIHVATVMNQEFEKLGFTDALQASFILIDEEKEVQYLWGAQTDSQLVEYLTLPLLGDDVLQERYDAWKRKEPVLSVTLTGEKRIRHLEVAMPLENINEKQKQGRAVIPDPFIFCCGFFKYGYLCIISTEVLDEGQQKILVRMAKVFEQTYTRFLDLQKAEAQTREAQIEASMERIRSKSLAMRTSDEIKDVMIEIRRQIDSLGQLDLEGSVVHLYEKGNPMFESIAAVRPPGESGNIVLANVFFPVNGTDRIKDMMDYYWSDTKEYTLEFDKEMAEEWQQVMLTYAPMIAERRVGFVENRRISDYAEYWNFADFSEGSLLLVTHSPASEDTKTVLRKASQVFDLAYRRYRDLQKAEARAKEAIRQASLDRVRGEIASMRSTEDLNRITPLIWNELTALGVLFIRCGVFIIDEKSEIVDIYLSSPDGKSLGVMKLPFNSNDLTANTVKAWKKDCVYHQFWSRDAFISWTNSLVLQGFISDKEKYQGNQEAPAALNLNFIPFTQGMLYVGTAEELPNSEVELVKSLAKAFALAYSRYEDFVKLEMAKSEIESTLSELKATQSQLVQQEKLASLGQLTAGIAHEIKNPLNFVNNFSEVSLELVEEAREEVRRETEDRRPGSEKAQLRQGFDEQAKVKSEKSPSPEGIPMGGGGVEAIAEVGHVTISANGETTSLILEILDDIEANLRKIHEHGSRADGIVQSMLMHSRGGDGKMEPTPLNPIIKEYVNLAFHGMRASKEPINVDIDLQLDESVGEVPLVAEDFSRVILNLTNNAFDAMRDKLTGDGGRGTGYVPKLTVRTHQSEKTITIEIEDNGPGFLMRLKTKSCSRFLPRKKEHREPGWG
jgi:signal transduction histidine kinase